MSTVRMCDRCGRLFSEREDDWTSMTATRQIRDQKTGNVRQMSEQLDACAKCSGSSDVPQPSTGQLLDDPWAQQEREQKQEERRRAAAASED